MIPETVLKTVKQYNNISGYVALVIPGKGLISLNECSPMKWQDAIKKMEATIYMHQNDSRLRKTTFFVGSTVSCEGYPFCVCDLE